MGKVTPKIGTCSCAGGGTPPCDVCAALDALGELLCEKLENLDVTIGDINIEELDVTASGLATLDRCTPDCEPVTLILCKDENHAGGQGDTTDTGDFDIEFVGWVDAVGVFTPGAYDGVLQSCTGCDCRTQWIDKRHLCLPGESDTETTPLADGFQIDDAADNGAGSTWLAAIGSNVGVTAPGPSPTGSAAIYTGTASGVAYTVEMVDYAAGTAPSALTRRNMTIENPLMQDGAGFTDPGFDQTTGSSLNPNAFLVCFDPPVAAWSAEWLDLESTGDGSITLFDAAETQLATSAITYPNGEDGEDENHSIGFTRAAADVSHVLIAVGSSQDDPTLNSNRLAFGRMKFIEPGDPVIYCELTGVDCDGLKVVQVTDPDGVIVTDPDLLELLEECPGCECKLLEQILESVDTVAGLLQNPVKVTDRCVVAIGNSTGTGYEPGDEGTAYTCIRFLEDGTVASQTEWVTVNGVVYNEPGVDFDWEDFRDCPAPPVEAFETFCVVEWENFIDNHFSGERPAHPVAYPQDTHNVVYECSDGTSFELLLPATGAGTWGPWNDAHAAALAASGKAWERRQAPFDGDTATPYGAYVAVTCCAGDKTIVAATATVVGGKRDGRKVPLLTGSRVTRDEQVKKCIVKGQPDRWEDAAGNPIPEPACIVGCSVKCPIPVKPDPTCTVQVEGPLCDIVLQEDADGNPIDPTEDDVVQSDVFLEIVNCTDGSQSITAFTLPGDPAEPEPYDVQGYLGDCDTLEPIEPPVPACSPDCQFIPVEWMLHHGGTDNNGPSATGNGPIVWRPTESVSIEVELADGTVATVDVAATTGWTPQINLYRDALAEAFPDCVWTARCHNPKTGGGCGNIPGPAPEALLGNMAYRYVHQECCTADRLIVRATIVASSNPARVGNESDVQSLSSACIKGFQCVTCDGVKLFDADMNPVPAASLPLPGCCNNCPGPVDALVEKFCQSQTDCGASPDVVINADGTGSLDVAIVAAQATNHTYNGPANLTLTPGNGDASVIVGNQAPYIPATAGTSGILFDFPAVDVLAECDGDVTVRLCLDQASASGTVLHLWQADGQTAYSDVSGNFGGIHRNTCTPGQVFMTTPWPAVCMTPGYTGGNLEACIDYVIPAADLSGGLQATLMSINPPGDSPVNGLRMEIVIPADQVDCLVAGDPGVVPLAVTQACGPFQVEIVEQPEQPTCVVEYLLGCDDIAGDGSDIFQYLIPIQTCTLAGLITSQDQLDPIAPDADGVLDVYTPVNPIECDPATLDFDEELYCDGGNGVTFIRRTIVVAGVGAIIEEVTLDGTTPYIVIGPITAGACVIPQPEPDVEACGTICTIGFDGRFINLAGGFASITLADGTVCPLPAGTVRGSDLAAAACVPAAYLGFTALETQTVAFYEQVTEVTLGNGTTLFPACRPRQAQLVKICDVPGPVEECSTCSWTVSDTIDGVLADGFRGSDIGQSGAGTLTFESGVIGAEWATHGQPCIDAGGWVVVEMTHRPAAGGTEYPIAVTIAPGQITNTALNEFVVDWNVPAPTPPCDGFTGPTPDLATSWPQFSNSPAPGPGGVVEGIRLDSITCWTPTEGETVDVPLRSLSDCTIGKLAEAIRGEPIDVCGGSPAASDTLTMTPGGSDSGGVCDDSLIKVLQPAAGIKVPIKVKYPVKVRAVKVASKAATAERDAATQEKEASRG